MSLLPVSAHCLQVQSIRVCQCDICNVHGFLAGGGHSSWHQGQHQAAQCHALPYQDLCRAIRSANILPDLLHTTLISILVVAKDASCKAMHVKEVMVHSSQMQTESSKCYLSVAACVGLHAALRYSAAWIQCISAWCK